MADLTETKQDKPQVEEIKISQLLEDENAKRTKVASVVLADAVAKDSLSPWSWSMLRLYGVMLLVTLSTSSYSSFVSFCPTVKC